MLYREGIGYAGDAVKLAPMKQEKLLIFMAAEVVRPRRERGLKLNYHEGPSSASVQNSRRALVTAGASPTW